MFQLLGVKVRLDLSRLPSVSSPVMLMVTSWLGAVLSTTVKVACPPASVVVTVLELTVIPAVSLSVLVMLTVAV